MFCVAADPNDLNRETCEELYDMLLNGISEMASNFYILKAVDRNRLSEVLSRAAHILLQENEKSEEVSGRDLACVAACSFWRSNICCVTLCDVVCCRVF